MTDEPPGHLIDWHGNAWRPDSDTPAAHPNARFTAPAAQCPSIADEWEDQAGVPISAMLFGGRRATVVPLVRESLDWEHGVFLGSIMSSETTAAAAGAVGQSLCPFARLRSAAPMADYFPLGWTSQTAKKQSAGIFYGNWFRKMRSGVSLGPSPARTARLGGSPPLRVMRSGRDPGRLSPRRRDQHRGSRRVSRTHAALRGRPELMTAELPSIHYTREFGDSLHMTARAVASLESSLSTHDLHARRRAATAGDYPWRCTS